MPEDDKVIKYCRGLFFFSLFLLKSSINTSPILINSTRCQGRPGFSFTRHVPASATTPLFESWSAGAEESGEKQTNKQKVCRERVTDDNVEDTDRTMQLVVCTSGKQATSSRAWTSVCLWFLSETWKVVPQQNTDNWTLWGGGQTCGERSGCLFCVIIEQFWSK